MTLITKACEILGTSFIIGVSVIGILLLCLSIFKRDSFMRLFRDLFSLCSWSVFRQKNNM